MNPDLKRLHQQVIFDGSVKRLRVPQQVIFDGSVNNSRVISPSNKNNINKEGQQEFDGSVHIGASISQGGVGSIVSSPGRRNEHGLEQ